MFELLARYTSQCDGTIVTCDSPVTLFLEGGDIYLQETILWGFYPCQETIGSDGHKLDPIQLQAPLVISSKSGICRLVSPVK